MPDVTFSIEIEREDDGRWLAEVPALPGVMCYGQDRDEAVAFVQALALRVIAERLENREAPARIHPQRSPSRCLVLRSGYQRIGDNPSRAKRGSRCRRAAPKTASGSSPRYPAAGKSLNSKGNSRRRSGAAPNSSCLLPWPHRTPTERSPFARAAVTSVARSPIIVEQ